MFSERLAMFIASLGETPTSFESKIGVSKGAILKPIKNGKTVGVEIMAKIFSKYPHLNFEWLIADKGAMSKGMLAEWQADPAPMLSEDQVVEYRFLKGAKTAVSMIVDKNAANWDGTPDSGKPVIDFVFYLPAAILPKGNHYVAFQATGDNMEPTIPLKSKVIADFVKPEEYQYLQNGAVYVIITRDRVAIRRIANKLKDSGTLRLFSDNREYPTYDIQQSEIVSIWRAKLLFSNKFGNESNHLYQLYQNLNERIGQLEEKHKAD